ncbi:MAG: helix-turn-helix transcriptional regulator [bacterium]|nr:helix-turn-helix transcriptional regulator [bacterium]
MRQSLRARRVRARLTVAEVALRLGISRSHYYKIEQGKRNPSMELGKEIADVLGTTVDVLFFGSELDAPSSPSARHPVDAGGARSA